MKTTQNIFGLVIMLIITTTLFNNKIVAQDASKDKSADKMQQMLNSKDFVFVAQSVTPLQGGYRQLTTTYDLRVAGDSVICNLPYFGRAYSAPIDLTGGGINFTSTSYDYGITPQKKNSWNVTIKPKDETDTKQLFLSVYKDGTATLQVISNNRQPIMFNGNVRSSVH